MSTPLEALACWLNVWADKKNHAGRSREWRLGYEQAVKDIAPHINALAPDWLKAWRAGERGQSVSPAGTLKSGQGR
jgi:hypothetical protein